MSLYKACSHWQQRIWPAPKLHLKLISGSLNSACHTWFTAMDNLTWQLRMKTCINKEVFINKDMFIFSHLVNLLNGVISIEFIGRVMVLIFGTNIGKTTKFQRNVLILSVHLVVVIFNQHLTSCFFIKVHLEAFSFQVVYRSQMGVLQWLLIYHFYQLHLLS